MIISAIRGEPGEGVGGDQDAASPAARLHEWQLAITQVAMGRGDRDAVLRAKLLHRKVLR
jgi:hypothetical protein